MRGKEATQGVMRHGCRIEAVHVLLNDLNRTLRKSYIRTIKTQKYTEVYRHTASLKRK